MTIVTYHDPLNRSVLFSFGNLAKRSVLHSQSCTTATATPVLAGMINQLMQARDHFWHSLNQYYRSTPSACCSGVCHPLFLLKKSAEQGVIAFLKSNRKETCKNKTLYCQSVFTFVVILYICIFWRVSLEGQSLVCVCVQYLSGCFKSLLFIYLFIFQKEMSSQSQ